VPGIKTVVAQSVPAACCGGVPLPAQQPRDRRPNPQAKTPALLWFALFDQHLRHGSAGPNLDRAGCFAPARRPMHELAHREIRPPSLCRERRRPRHLIQRVVFHRQRPLEGANIASAARNVPSAGWRRWIEQIKNFFLADRRVSESALGRDWEMLRAKARLSSRRRRRRSRCHRARRSRVPAPACRVVCAFTAGVAVGIDELFRERGEEIPP